MVLFFILAKRSRPNFNIKILNNIQDHRGSRYCQRGPRRIRRHTLISTPDLHVFVRVCVVIFQWCTLDRENNLANLNENETEITSSTEQMRIPTTISTNKESYMI